MADKKLKAEEVEDQVEDQEDDVEVEIEDDTPEEDRGREPMPKEIVDELEADELEEYTGKVRLRMKQLKKVYHDQRREKERYARENEEALSVARRLMEENKSLKSTLSSGELQLLASIKAGAELELQAAKRAYREAYEAGDAEKITEANDKMAAAGYRLEQVKAYRPQLGAAPALQPAREGVEKQPGTAAQPPQKMDAETTAWQERNEWWGTDEEMTGAAFGLHQRLLRDKGNKFIGTPKYWETIDANMRRRFPEYFEGEDDDTAQEPAKAKANGRDTAPAKRTPNKSATVVAPASRSTSSKKVRLTQTQLNLAKKFGLTPEQYAREAVKLQDEDK
jgi:hypothetical protein